MQIISLYAIRGQFYINRILEKILVQNRRLV